MAWGWDEQGQVSDVRDPSAGSVPSGAGILALAPNPFNPSTTIAFVNPEPGRVRLSVYDAMGRRVSVILDEVMAGGTMSAQWRGRDRSGLPAPSGVYFLRLEIGREVCTRKMMIIK